MRQRDVVNQEALDQARVTLVGGTLSGEFVLAGLAGLGVGTVGVIAEDMADGFLGPLAEHEGISGAARECLVGMAKKINDEKNYLAVDSPLEDSLIIDCGPKAGAYTGRVVHGSCLENQCQYGQDGSTAYESPIAACILGGALTQLARQYAQGESFRQSFSYKTQTPRQSKALFVGAGATGTWGALVATLSGFSDFTILDFDTIEAHNLNRQILFYERVGQKKAELLHERLAVLGKKGGFVLEKITKENLGLLDEYETIFSCVDNLACRQVINDYAIEQGIRVINSGTNAYGGNASAYVPGETGCLACQTNIDRGLIAEIRHEAELKERRQRGCVFENNPSIIIPNMIMGAAMIEGTVWTDELIRQYSGDDNILFKTEVENAYRDDCACGGLRHA